MKYKICPSCKLGKVSFLRKMFAGEWFPIVCECGAFLVPRRSINIAFAFIESILLTVFGFWAFFKYPLLHFIIVFSLGLIALEVLRALFVPLVVKKARHRK